jgi:putative DNA-invertase from lambdoid prophage Rac
MTQILDKARLWLRVSNSEQNIENQRIALELLCNQRGFKIDKEYVAKGLSGWTGKQRDLLESALRDARAGKFTILVIWALDRLTREGIAETLRICEEFRKAGVTIVSHQESWIEEQEDIRDFLISFAGWNSRSESNRKSERNKASHVRMLAEGKWGRGKPPFGYLRDGDGKLATDPENVKTIELIYHLYTTNRIGVRQIKKELERRGLRTGSKKTFWAPSVIEKILKDPVYKGQHSSGLTAPVIIDAELWQLAQDKREANQYLKPGYAHKYALQGRAECKCGGRIRVEHPGRGRGQAIYFCNNRYANSYHVMKGNKPCKVPRRRVDAVEQQLLDELFNTFNDPAKLALVVRTTITRLQDEIDSMSGDVAGLAQEHEEVVESIRRTEESWIMQRLSTDHRDELVAELEVRRDTLAESLDRVSPEKRQALEEKQEILRGAKHQLENLETREQSGMPSWKFSLNPAVAESDALQKFRESGYSAFSRDPNPSLGIPEALNKVLTELNMTAMFRKDDIEFTGDIELNIDDQPDHPHASLMGGS